MPSPETEVLEALGQAGFSANQADIRRSGRRTQIHGLAWGDAGQFSAAETAAAGAYATNGNKRSNTIPQAAVTNGLAFGILLLAALTLLVANWQRGRSLQVAVPQLVGEQVEQAMHELAGIGLQPEPVATASDEPVGTVLTLEPGPATASPGAAASASVSRLRRPAAARRWKYRA